MSKTFEPIEFQVGDRVTFSNTKIGKCTIASLYLKPINEYKTEYYAEVYSNKDGEYYKVPVATLIKEKE